jgi:hypothetical protein
MEATAGTLDVGPPWLDRDQNLQEILGCFPVADQERGFTKNGKNEGRSVNSIRAQHFNFLKAVLYWVPYKAFLGTIPVSRSTNI